MRCFLCFCWHKSILYIMPFCYWHQVKFCSSVIAFWYSKMGKGVESLWGIRWCQTAGLNCLQCQEGRPGLLILCYDMSCQWISSVLTVNGWMGIVMKSARWTVMAFFLPILLSDSYDPDSSPQGGDNLLVQWNLPLSKPLEESFSLKQEDKSLTNC